MSGEHTPILISPRPVQVSFCQIKSSPSTNIWVYSRFLPKKKNDYKIKIKIRKTCLRLLPEQLTDFWCFVQCHTGLNLALLFVCACLSKKAQTSQALFWRHLQQTLLNYSPVSIMLLRCSHNPSGCLVFHPRGTLWSISAVSSAQSATKTPPTTLLPVELCRNSCWKPDSSLG